MTVDPASQTRSAKTAARNGAKRLFARLQPRTLSGQLLLLTIIFVMLAEVLIYVPSIANFRERWLEERLAAAQIASLAMEATMGEEVAPKLENELLDNANVLLVALRRNEARILMLSKDDIPMVEAAYDLRAASPLALIHDAFQTLAAGGKRTIMVKGQPKLGGGDEIEVILDERALYEAMVLYSRNILSLSIVISLLTASLVFISLRMILVRPLRRLTQNMIGFSARPEDAGRVIQPLSNALELRTAEQELAKMQSQIRSSLNQKTHLARLGTAVSKINHDLRNILASAQLISDSLATSDDPKVQRLAPKLVSSIDRAIDLATNTLKYGKAEEPPSKKRDLALKPLVDDVGEHIGLPQSGKIVWNNRVDETFHVTADPDQLFRILLNLGRNAMQALCAARSDAQGHIDITAYTEEKDNQKVTVIDISDNGPGIPEEARNHLFEAFSGSARAGGTGLGLAIVKELTLAHGGTVDLVHTSAHGTTFRLILPREDDQGADRGARD